MLLSSPEQFKDLFNVTVKTSHEVTEIDRKEQTVTVKNLNDNTTSDWWTCHQVDLSSPTTTSFWRRVAIPSFPPSKV